MTFQMLEDFFYFLRDEQQKQKGKPTPYQIRFHQKTVAEFKTTLFNTHYGHRALMLNITPKDLEIVYRNTILENDFDMEYCIDTI